MRIRAWVLGYLIHTRGKEIVSGGGGDIDKKLFRAAKYSEIAKPVFQKSEGHRSLQPFGSYGTVICIYRNFTSLSFTNFSIVKFSETF